MLKKVNDKLILTENEINTLKRYDIIVDSMTSLDEVLLMIDNLSNNYELSDDEQDELDIIANNIAERKYYNYTNK